MDVLVQDAIDSLKKHPRITNVHARVQTQGQDVVVYADIDTNLASTWKALGRSPNGVLPVETVEIVFPSNYPQGAPVPTLRADFDASLPHVNPHDKGERVPPCIYQGTLLDALHSEGFERLIVQLVDWLERAAEGTLINESQGWEPARRAIREHVVDFDVEELEKRMPRLGGLQLLTMFQVWKKTDDQSYACSPHPYLSTKLTGSDLRALVEGTHAAAAHYSGRTLLAICWPSRGFDGVVTPHARYESDTASSMQEIAARADEYGCNLALQRFRKEFSSAAQHLRFTCNFPVYIALAVKRPHHLIGMTTDYEFLVYRLLAPIPQGMDGVDVKAIPVPILSPVSTALLRRTSAIPNDVTGLRSSYLGCGSLGSKVIMHVARAGFAPELVIDHGYFRPHNAARHVLMPNDVFSAGTKADKLAALVNQLAPANATKPFGQEVQAIPLDGRTDYGVVLDPNAVLVNTTGSAPVRHFLAGSAIRARTKQACLTELGKVGIMTMEGPSRNPSTTDLMALTYEQLRKLGRLSVPQHISSGQLQVGVGCNSVTLPMSDASISLIAAGVGQAILGMQGQGMPTSGQISIGTVDDDGMSVKWQRSDVGTTQIVHPEHADGWTVRVLAPAHLKMTEAVRRYSGVETGGMIVGRVSATGREIVITDVLQAPSDSVRSPALFVLGTDQREVLVREYEDSANGVLWCLGTWHSHLEDIGPSQMDRDTAHVLQRQMQRLTVLLIHRPTGYSAVVQTGGA